MAEMAMVAEEEALVPWWLVLLQGIFAAIIGVLLLVSPAKTTFVLVQLLGIWWFVSGIMNLVMMFVDHRLWGWKLCIGILGMLAGLAILHYPLWATLAVPAIFVIVLGIDGLIIGVIDIIRAFQGGGWGAGLLGALSIIFGLILLGNVWAATLVTPFAIGVFVLVGGIVAIIASFSMRPKTA